MCYRYGTVMTEKVREIINMIFITGGAYQGKYSYARHCFGEDCQIINAYQNTVRTQLEEGKNPIEEAKKLLEGDTEKLIIICDEVGAGIIPMDEFECSYRENVGRTACFFAQNAERVLRIVCGIAVEIK
jgi:adenosylcobinamide kinase/adenosylcobinamide-phosphate guanylyltransferase